VKSKMVEDLVVPDELLREYPIVLRSLSVCKYQCFRKWGGGCSGAYTESAGVPVLGSTLAQLKETLKNKCFIAAPDFFGGGGYRNIGSVELDPTIKREIELLYYLSAQGIVSPGLRIESRCDSFLWACGKYGIKLSLAETTADTAKPTDCPAKSCILKPEAKYSDWEHKLDTACSAQEQLDMWKSTTAILLSKSVEIAGEELLRAINVKEVWFGVESGSQEMLDHYGKHMRVEQAIKATQQAQQMGLKVGWYLVVSEEDTQDSLLKTSCLVEQCKPEATYISVVDSTHHVYTKKLQKQLELLLSEIVNI